MFHGLFFFMVGLQFLLLLMESFLLLVDGTLRVFGIPRFWFEKAGHSVSTIHWRVGEVDLNLGSG
jgi:hypothetical protein